MDQNLILRHFPSLEVWTWCRWKIVRGGPENPAYLQMREGCPLMAPFQSIWDFSIVAADAQWPIVGLPLQLQFASLNSQNPWFPFFSICVRRITKFWCLVPLRLKQKRSVDPNDNVLASPSRSEWCPRAKCPYRTITTHFPFPILPKGGLFAFTGRV